MLSLFCALYFASSRLTTPFATNSCKHWSRVCMPWPWPVWMAEYICAILPSRIKFRMAGVPIMISCAAIRPPPTRFIKVCEITARRLSDIMARTISFSAAGNTSTIRSMVFAAELVCKVPNTKWPVSAAVSARRMVSRSRISPTSTTSGSSILIERIDAKAGQLGDFKRKIGFVKLLESLALLVVHDVVHHAVHFFVHQGGHVDAFHVAVHANHRGHARRQMQVRRVVLHRKGEKLRDINRHLRLLMRLMALATSSI